MVKTKPSRYPEGKESKNLTDEHKGQATKTKRYRGKNNRTKTQVLELKAETNFKGRCSDLEGYGFELGTRVLEKFARTMKELELYLRENYSDIYQPVIMNKKPVFLPDPEMPTIIPVTGTESTNTDKEMTYLENNNIDEDIRQKLRKKDMYGTEMHNIYNIIMDNKNDKLKYKVASDSTFQLVKSDQDPIW